MPDPVVAEELELLERVSRRLSEIGDKPTPDEAPLVQDLRGLREEILSHRDGKDAMALHEQWHRQNALLQQLRSAREAPVVDPRSPYFGHLRLLENGQARDVCLGRATCVESGIRIVDWRHAPVSKLFYRYEQGDDYEEEIAGRERVGEVLARRTVTIRDGVLERVEAPEGVFSAGPNGWERRARERTRLAGGEGSALRAHGTGQGEGRRLGTDLLGDRRRVDKRLPEITGLIDPSQFGLISRPRQGFLVVRGAAGSGKTTVALHRIAWLAYDEPEIDSPETLFVVLSAALRRYVGHVLPSLGVSQVEVQTWHEWASSQRRRHFPELPEGERPDTPAAVQRLKLHPALGLALEAQVGRVAGPATAEQARDDWASVCTQERLLAEVFERHAPGSVRGSELARFVDWNRRQQEDLAAMLAGEHEVEPVLDAEDDALLLRAWQLRVGPLRAPNRRPLQYRHVAVDEVQDFSPLEVCVLLDTLDEKRSITLAGDTQQHLVEVSGFTSWPRFLAELGVDGEEIETLRVSYRSSREIVDVARRVLGALADEDEPEVTRSGPPVELFRFTDRGACVAFLAEALRVLTDAEPLASVAVLTPTPELSALYVDGLAASDVPRLRHVREQDFTFAPGVEVTELDQVKGLEFDYVIVVDVDREHFPETDTARRRLHVAATRAVHQLWLTTIGTPSALLDGVGDGRRQEARSRPDHRAR